jgi:hypothetical protein
MLATNSSQSFNYYSMFIISNARSWYKQFVFSRFFWGKNFARFVIEFITRHCLPSGNWSMVSYKSCVYPDVWDLMMTFYISRTVQQRKVCLIRFLFRNRRFFFLLYSGLYRYSSSCAYYWISWIIRIIYQCSSFTTNIFDYKVNTWIGRNCKILFFFNRSLYCSRTKIHINLLLAIFIQIIARIVNYGFVFIY